MPAKSKKSVVGKNLTKQKTKAVSTEVNYMADAGKGLENADKDSYAIPFLTMLQKLSPQVDTVDGAKAGLFINTVNNETQETVCVIPCGYARKYLRWAPRESGGGFKGQYSPLEVESGKVEGLDRNDKGQLTIGDDILRDTRIHYVLMETPKGAWRPAVLSLTSTQIKKSKRWMSMIQGIEMELPDGRKFNPASFSHIYILKSVKEENNQGKWFGINIELVGRVTDPEVYNAARTFSEQAAADKVRTVDPTPDVEEQW